MRLQSLLIVVATTCSSSAAFLYPTALTRNLALKQNTFDTNDFDNEFLKALGGPKKSEEEMAQADEASERGKRFREMMEESQQGGSQFRPVVNPFLNTTVGRNEPPPPRERQGRPSGRNRDADTIANTADVYFAQLKRDSTVRTLARQRGNDTTAEAVFQDEGISKLNDLVQINPYTKAQNEEMAKMLETAEEEMLLPRQEEREQHDPSYSGISYKERLQQRKQKKTGGAQPQQAATPPQPQTASEPAKEAMASASAPAAPVPVAQKTATTPAPAPPVSTPLAQSPAPASPPEPAPKIQPPAPRAEQPASTVSELGVPSNAEEDRTKIRTLMGLLLKHRGGPGFGKGRLQGNDIQTFEKLLGEVTDQLGKETQSPGLSAPTDQALATVTRPAPRSAPQALQTSDMTRRRMVEVPDTMEGDPLAGMIACLEGAIQMYVYSPPELKREILINFRAALASAVSICDRLLSENGTPIAGSTATSALSAAPQQQALGPSQQVATEMEELTEMASAALASDPHSETLKGILETIQNASGSGRFGLREDLSLEEAAELLDQISNMRSILLAELESGIPNAQIAQPFPGMQTAKYQEMLARKKSGIRP